MPVASSSIRMGGQYPFPGPRIFSAPRRSKLQQQYYKQRLLLSPVMQRKRAVEKIKAAHAVRRSSGVKRSVVGQHSSLPAQAKLLPAVAPPKASSSKTVIRAAPVAKKAAPVIIDLTISESEEEGEWPINSPLRHPLVTPRIHRKTPGVSKRRTPKTTAMPAARQRGSWDSESEDESMLETMLTADMSGSDMDCDSSDVESPARPSNLAPFLARPGPHSGAFDIRPRQVPPKLPRRSAFIK
ncbi:hypothetical protein BC628DRAFT_278689 [Trametes gibbosa]|nr:hypothetical protein BC628DRAFT_278689 [Trametes gibbosa]